MAGNSSTDQRQLAAQQAFALQYITVMILILAFLVGTFSSRKIAKDAVQPVLAPSIAESEEVRAAPAPHILKSELLYTDLFFEETTEVRTEKVEPLVELLLNHDLVADIKINLGFCAKDNSPACFKQEMEGAKNLSDFFVARGLPFTGFRIFYSPKMTAGAAINFMDE